MLSFINSWVKGIIIAVIISTIIEMILPEGNIKKYVKTVIGVFIVFVIISPIVTKITGREIKLDTFELPEGKQYEVATIDTNAYIENTYTNNIKQDIIDNLKKQGYEVKKAEIKKEKNEESYGNINKITLDISKKKTDSSSQIQTVEININDKTKKKEQIDAEEVEKIKDNLSTTYGVEKEKIYIN